MMTTDTRLPPVDGRDHVVQFYERDEELVQTVAAYLVEGLRAGGTVIVIATRVHIDAFQAALSAVGIDVTGAVADRTVVALDASEMLARFMTADGPDSDAFDEVIGRLVRESAANGRPVRAFGEMVALLWDSGDVAGAIELETLWNKLVSQAPFSLFCAYPTQWVGGSDHIHALDQVCHLHTAIVGGATVPLGSRSETTRAFARAPHSTSAARRFVVESLQQWDRIDLADSASLIVSELATNAVVHAKSGFTVVVRAHDDCIRILVRDHSSLPPVFGTLKSATATSGRGVALVAALADQWGSQPTADGKIVWADLR